MATDEWNAFEQEFNLLNTDNERTKAVEFITTMYQLNFDQFQFLLSSIKFPENQLFIQKIAYEQLGFEIVANMTPPSYLHVTQSPKSPVDHSTRYNESQAYTEIYLN